MQKYQDFIYHCKEHIDLFDKDELTKEHIKTDIPYTDFETNLVMFFLQKDRPSTQNFRCPYWGKVRTISLNELSD
jgi:hypothetical protein